MAILQNWIMQILILMLIGTIVELLLPSNHMKKYVNLVVGLLLLLILTQPILYLFSVDVTSIMNRVETSFTQDDVLLKNTEKDIELQKNEIQSTQDAYIWDEISSQLKQVANQGVKENFSLSITDLTVTPPEKEDKPIEIMVMLHQDVDEQEGAVESIDPVDIDLLQEPEKRIHPKESKEVQQYLAEVWDVDPNQIHIQWEGQID